MRLHAVTTTLLFLGYLLLPATVGAQSVDDKAAKKELEGVAKEAKETISNTEKPESSAATLTSEEPSEVKDEGPKKPWSVGVSLGHSISTGTFLEHEQMQAYSDSISQSWGLNASYRFEVLGHKLTAGVGMGLSLSLVTPNNSLDRRFFLGDGSLSLSDGSIYKDEWSGINLSGGLSLSLPISPESRHREKWTTLGTRLGLSRSFGDLSLSYSFSFNKFFHGSDTQVKNVSHARESWSTSCSLFTDDNSDQAYRCFSGAANANFSIRNSISVGYAITDHLGASYSLGISNMRKINRYPEEDEYQSPRADNNAGGSDSFSTSIGLSYDIAGQFGDMWSLPFSLSASLGVSTGHGVFKPTQDEIWWPLFYNSMGEDFGNTSAIPEAGGSNVNFAAGNYGSFSFGLSGSY